MAEGTLGHTERPYTLDLYMWRRMHTRVVLLFPSCSGVV